jgi:hypothetical protein
VARAAFLAVAGVVLALGFWAAYTTRWYCDDIFITLRYAQQFLSGHGFVYNVGERVEGYTHFLWLVIVTALQRAGLDPVGVVVWGGLVSYLGTLAVFAVISRRMAPRGAVFFVPFTALALVANRECRIWATGGLETFFFTLLLSLAFFVQFFSRARERVRLVLASTFLVLAAMTRPDALLVYAVAGVFVILRAARAPARTRALVRDVAWFLAPLFVVYVPYIAWKLSFYGSILPNTYYAKAAYQPYYSQGFYYIWLYLRAHPTSMLFILALPALAMVLVRTRHNPESESATTIPRAPAPVPARDTAAALVALVVVVAYLVGFVARVGGDFMYARFVGPMLPFAYFLVEWTLRRALALARILRAAALVLLALAVVAETGLRNRLMLEEKDGVVNVQEHHGIIDEHHYYTRLYLIENDRRAGELLQPCFDGLDATVLLRGQACFGYFARFKTLIENSGLTDSTIAHQPLQQRGRIGHEKSPAYNYLLQRRVNFMFSRKPYKDAEYRVVQMLLPGNVPVAAEIITYDTDLVRRLAARLGRNIRFTPFESYLDRYIAEELPTKTPEELAGDYAEFEEFYFETNEDPGRKAAFTGASR